MKAVLRLSILSNNLFEFERQYQEEDFMERVKVDRPGFDKRLPELLKAGYKVSEICTQIGCSRATFYRSLKRVPSDMVLAWKEQQQLR